MELQHPADGNEQSEEYLQTIIDAITMKVYGEKCKYYEENMENEED